MNTKSHITKCNGDGRRRRRHIKKRLTSIHFGYLLCVQDSRSKIILAFRTYWFESRLGDRLFWSPLGLFKNAELSKSTNLSQDNQSPGWDRTQVATHYFAIFGSCFGITFNPLMPAIHLTNIWKFVFYLTGNKIKKIIDIYCNSQMKRINIFVGKM